MKEPRLSKAETRILEQYWKLGTASVREVLESLPEDERVAYTTVQTLVYRLEEKSYRLARLAGPAQTTNPRSDPAMDITVCGGHRGWHVSNHRTYRLLFPAEALIAAWSHPSPKSAYHVCL
jgi:Penicillinase repressor